MIHPKSSVNEQRILSILLMELCQEAWVRVIAIDLENADVFSTASVAAVMLCDPSLWGDVTSGAVLPYTLMVRPAVAMSDMVSVLFCRPDVTPSLFHE